jgi:hypothetical protein
MPGLYKDTSGGLASLQPTAEPVLQQPTTNDASPEESAEVQQQPQQQHVGSRIFTDFFDSCGKAIHGFPETAHPPCG